MASELLSRVLSFASIGLRFDNQRSYYNVFGYKNTLTFNDFLLKYKRQDIAARIIDAPAQALWRNPPEVTGGEGFDAAWKALVKKEDLWNVFERADRLAGLGHFSTILFGFDSSSGNLESTAKGAKTILYTQPYSQESVGIKKLDDNTRSERFGRPEIYSIKLINPQRSTGTGADVRITGSKTLEKPVHWSRVLHVAESILDDNLFGTPRLCKVFNLLDDLLKVAGGSAETFWLEGRKGIHANVDPEMELKPEDETALSDEIDEYHHQLRRVIRTRGVDINALGSDTPDPSGNFKMIMALISGTTGIPQRILLGSEAGQLASEQDRANWAERIEERRKFFAEPVVLKPFIALCQNAGVLPESEVEFEWPSAFIMSPLEEGQTMAQKARATQNLSKQGESMFPVATQEESRELIGLPAKGGPEIPERVDPAEEEGVDSEEFEDVRQNVEHLNRRV